MINYPTHLNIDGVDYELNQGWQIALECMNVIYDTEITDVERSVQLITLLLGEVSYEVLASKETLIKVVKYLQCEKDIPEEDNEQVMDYNQDMTSIWSSIKAHYNVDIFKEDVNWYEFNNMIQGLPSDCALMRIVDIRMMDPKSEKDAKRKKQIIDAQKHYAIDGVSNEVQLDDKTAKFLEKMGKRVK